MNTFWLKIAGGAIAVVALIILINVFSSSEPKPQPIQDEKGFSDQVETDRKRFLSKPAPVEPNNQNVQTTQQTEPNQPVKTIIEIPKPPEQVTLYFVELSEIDQVEAERLLNVAVPGRSIGRLPMTGYKLMMVDNCRTIISRWPESWYAYRAKQMLADLPPHYWSRYKITKEEVDISMYTHPRPGTKAFTFEESR